IIFVCENNLYSEMTPIKDSVLIDDLAERGGSYGIPSIVVDGNDVRSVSLVAEKAIERARNGKGRTLIEAKTYRIQGHMFGHAETYRKKEEVQHWRGKDPLKKFKELCLKESVLFEEELDEIIGNVQNEIKESAKRAAESEEPELEE